MCIAGLVWSNLGKHIYTTPLGVIKETLEDIPYVIQHEGWWFPIKTEEQGASTSITVAALPSHLLSNGSYYKDCVVFEESESARNMEDAKALFDWCDEVTKDFQ